MQTVLRYKKILALCVLAVLGSWACFGNFSATRGLYRFNSNVSDNRFVQTLLFWGLIIIPAYELFVLGDVLIFNVIQFWSGRDVLGGDTTAMNVDSERPRDDTLVLRHNGQIYELRMVGENSIAVSVNGTPMGTATVDDGGNLTLRSPAGEILQVIGADEQHTLFDALRSMGMDVSFSANTSEIMQEDGDADKH